VTADFPIGHAANEAEYSGRVTADEMKKNGGERLPAAPVPLVWFNRCLLFYKTQTDIHDDIYSIDIYTHMYVL